MKSSIFEQNGITLHAFDFYLDAFLCLDHSLDMTGIIFSVHRVIGGNYLSCGLRYWRLKRLKLTSFFTKKAQFLSFLSFSAFLGIFGGRFIKSYMFKLILVTRCEF